MDLSGKVESVGITFDGVWGPLFIAIARRLKDEFGSRIHVYFRSSQELESERAVSGDCWDSAQVVDVLERSLESELPHEDEIVARARAHEARLGTTISNFFFSHRQFGRGYSPGSVNYPRAPGDEKYSYFRLLHAYGALLDFWKGEVESKGITLLLHGNKEQAATARALGAEFRRMDVARYQNHWYWTPSEYFFNAATEQKFHTLRRSAVATARLEQAYGVSSVKDQRLRKRMSFPHALINSGHSTLRHLALMALRRDAAKNFRLRDRLFFPFREYSAYRRMTGAGTARLADIGDKPFVFFPMHKEPENSLLLMSPEYLNPHAAVMSVSRDLPAGILLGVKENLWSLGRRPKEYYDQIKDLRNVFFFDIREPGLEIVRRANAVVTITGTAGYEAAILGRPVITFGRHNLCSIVDHCMTVTDEVQLRGYLERALSREIDEEKARADGARFLEAIVASSFDMGDWAVIGAGKTRYRNFSDTDVESAYRGLLESFRVPYADCVESIAREAACVG